MREWGQTPFSFFESKLYDFKILKFAPGKWGLYTKFRHIWVDGWATGLIWSDILCAYCRIAGGETGEVCISRPAFVNAAPSDTVEEDRRFWADYLSGIELPPSEGTEHKNSADRRAFPLPDGLADKIRAFSAETGITPYTVFMSALAVYVNAIQSVPEVLMGLPRQNRPSDYLRSMLGVFVMEVPLRLRLSDGRGFAALSATKAAA